MAHPFFDAIAWPASRPDAQEFLAALLALFSTAPEIRSLYEKAGDNLEPLNTGQTPRLVWEEALANLVKGGRLRQFCEQLQAEGGPKNKAFQARLADVFAATALFEQRVLSTGVPVVDRADLRTKIALMVAKDSLVSVLIVRGGPKSGKSHGYHLFEVAAREAGAVPVLVARDLVFNVRDVVNELFAVVGGVPDDLKPDPNAPAITTGPAWYQLVCNRLLQAAVERDVRLWIGADDLGQDEAGQWLIDEEIFTFFNQFGQKMKAPQYRARFRLMLIHAPMGKTTNWDKPSYREAVVSIEEITEDSLVDFLRGWSQQKGRVIVEEQIAALAKEVIVALDAPPAPPPAGVSPEPERPRLERLYDLVEAMTQRLAPA